MTEVTKIELIKGVKIIHKIRSFVRRKGRLTKGQERALNDCWPIMGINFEEKQLNWTQIFENNNSVIVEIGFGMGA